MKLGAIKFSVIKTSTKDTFQIQFKSFLGSSTEWFDTDTSGTISVYEYIITTFGILDAPSTKEMIDKLNCMKVGIRNGFTESFEVLSETQYNN